MFDFLTLARLFRSFRDSIRDKDFAGIVSSTRELAELLGFGAEAKEVVELIASAQAGDWAGVLQNAGEFLIVIAERVGVPAMGAKSGDPVDAAIDNLEACAGVCADVVPDENDFNPLAVIMVVIQLIRLIRDWRNK